MGREWATILRKKNTNNPGSSAASRRDLSADGRFFFISARALLWAEELLMELLLLGRSFQECKLLLFILPYQPLYPLVIQSKYVGLSRIAPQKKNLFPRGVK